MFGIPSKRTQIVKTTMTQGHGACCDPDWTKQHFYSCGHTYDKGTPLGGQMETGLGQRMGTALRLVSQHLASLPARRATSEKWPLVPAFPEHNEPRLLGK